MQTVKYELQHIAGTCRNEGWQTISNMLLEICGDYDYNGDNKEEYLSKEAKENGFDSNADYMIDKLSKKKGSSYTKILDYVDAWMSSDPDYYVDYDVEILFKDDYIFVSIAILTRV